jgi:hypothetical protein
MATIGIAEIMKTLRTERAHTRKELKKLDRIISALRELSTNSAPARIGKRRKMSAAARRKIGAAQRRRWAKVRQQRAAKG